MDFTKFNILLYISQVSELWRTSYKLTKEFAHPEFRGPLRVASTVKARLENFKVNMPLINALCTPGIKDRHWEAMSVKVRWIKSLNCTPQVLKYLSAHIIYSRQRNALQE